MQRSHPMLDDHRATTRLAIGLWIAAGLLFVLVAVPGTRELVQRSDDVIHDLAVRLEWRPAVIVAEVLDFIGSGWFTWPLRIAIIVWLAAKKRWEGLIFWIFAVAVSEFLIGTSKALYERPRPIDALVETTGFSFPSGHATVGAVVAISLVIVLIPAGPRRRNLELIAAGFAFLMGLSRVYLRAHWFTDVAAGVALGAAIAIAAAAIVHWGGDWIHHRRLQRSPPNGRS
jgi:undecaprenyl-diphosphatase